MGGVVPPGKPLRLASVDMGLGSVVPFLDNDAASTWGKTGAKPFKESRKGRKNATEKMKKTIFWSSTC